MTVSTDHSLAPKLSVVIPVHNGASTLEHQLRAVLNAIEIGMEVIVVDNLSTDDTAQIVRSVAAANPAVRLVAADERAGESYARNIGMRAARSDLVAYCDADDEVSTTWAVAALGALQDAHYVTGPVDVDRLNPTWLAEVRGRRIFSEMPHTVGNFPFAHGCNMAMRRSTFVAIGGFDEQTRIGADIDFAIRAAQAGVRLVWSDRMIVHYRHRLGVRHRWRQAVAYGRAAAQFHRLADERWTLQFRIRGQARRLGWLCYSIPRLYRRNRRAQWMWVLALAIGEVMGSKG